MENMNRQWNRFSLQIQKSKEIVDELSKLYIVLHEKVRKNIVKCTLDPKYDPTQQAHQHLKTILDLLNRLGNPDDAYLKGVDPSILNKYEQQLVDLSQQIQKLIKGHRLSQNLYSKQFALFKKADKKQKYGLQSQIKQSQNRVLRSRSGKRSGKMRQNSQKETDKNRLIQQFGEYKKQYVKKKAKLQQQMQNHIDKKDNQVIFSKKYAGDNLQKYFQLRKQLLNLVLVDQHSKQIISAPNYEQIAKNDKKEVFEDKIFNQFKIKTKYMKKHVKDNILQALAEVKVKLLQQYHNSNISKLNQTNPDTLIVLFGKTKSKSTANITSKVQSQTVYNKTGLKPSQTARQSLNNKTKASSFVEPSKKKRYQMASKSSRPLVYDGQWNYQVQENYKKGIIDKIQMYRVANLQK